MDRWTHSMCYSCWNIRYSNRVPARVINAVKEKCCFCGLGTSSGIYIRHDPDDLELDCKGQHNDE